MLLSIEHQRAYSRGLLVLRTLFGFFYILLPHAIVLALFGIWGGILAFIAWWAILFTGRHPKGMFEFQVKLRSWGMRLSASIYNLVDGYPAFGTGGKSWQVSLNIPYPPSLSRGLLLLKTFFGGLYCGLPHGFCLYFRVLISAFVGYLAWWVVLITGQYPLSWHRFNVGTLRWMTRLDMYLNNLSDRYPPFSGKE